MGAVDFSIDPRLVESLAEALPLSVFVETGTFEGEAIARLRRLFGEIHSVELSDKYYGEAVVRFGDDSAVKLYHGDSTDVLRVVQPNLQSRSVLYWLDAHWCVADETSGDHSQCPLLEELQAIGSLNPLSVILIDDARLFLATPPAPHEVTDWPRLESVVHHLRSLSDEHEMMVVNDVIVFFPASARTSVERYARSSGIDWLVQLHQLEQLERERTEMSEALTERLEALNEMTEIAKERGATIAELSAALEELRRSRRTVLGLAWEPARRMRRRTRSWLAPRISLLYHYPPKPILLPTSYFHTRAPEPAPSIAVVTPSYQQGRFLERTMLSVLAQKYPALEYYVQDGGSTDDSTEILGHYEEYLTGWASAPDKGQADAINRAFAHTSGEIMGWLNSDDLLLPGALAYVARFFDEHPKVDVVYGNRLMIDENDGQVGAWILPRHSDHALRFADYVPQETLFWRRRIWEASGSELDLSFSYALDWDLLLRFQAAGARTVHVPRFLGAFRVHDNQKTSATALVGLEEMSLLRERVHGRLVPADELPRRLRPYFVHHRVIHGWHRVLDRLPLSRGSVNTDPDAYLHDFPVAASVRSAAPALSSRSPAGEPPASGPS